MYSSVVEEHIKRNLYLYAFLFSVLSSIILIDSRVIINADGVVYLAASQAFLDDGLLAAQAISPNTFLPVLIACLSSVSDFSLMVSADVINTLLLSILVLSYVYLVKQLGGNKSIQLIGAILIIINPSLIGYRESFFRDSGYWAFSILSLGLLLDYVKSSSVLSLGLWIASLGFAILFRPEAGIFTLAPLAILLTNEDPLKLRLLKVSKVYLVLLLCALFAFFSLYFLGLNSVYEGAFEHLYRYQESGQVQDLSFNEMTQKFSDLFRYPYPEDYVGIGFGLSLIPIFLNSLGGAMSSPVVLIFGYCYYRKAIFFPDYGMYKAYIFLSVLVLVAFLFTMYFITPRYATFLGLLLIAALPFSLYRLWVGKEKTRKIRVLVASCFFVLIIDSFISFGYSKQYLTEGIAWVNENIPVDSRVISNEKEITYSIERGKSFQDSEVIFGAWDEYDVSVILESYDYFVEDTFWNKEELLGDRYPEAIELARFTSERGNRLVVYKLH